MVKPVSKQLRISFLAGCLVLGAHVPGVSHADDGGVAENLNNSFKPDRILEARILADPALPKHTKRVSWVPGAIKVTTRYFGSSSESTLHLEGALPKKDAEEWHMVWSDRSVEIEENGVFSLDIPFDTAKTRLQLVAVGPRGEVEYHLYRVKIRMPEVPAEKPAISMMGEVPVITPPAPVKRADESEEEAAAEVGPDVSQEGRQASAAVEAVPSQGLKEADFNTKLDRRLFVSPGLGITHLNYTQTGQANYTAMMTTVKVSANYLLFPPKWDLGFTGFMNLFSLSKSASPDIRAIGMNLRIGYIFPEVQAPWRLSVYGGWYYSTMFASDGAFGYQNVSGPQLYPSIRRTLDNGCAISSYLKFSPISSALGIMKLSNSEMAIGFGYFIPGQARTYGITLDLARISLSSDTIDIQSTSLSLGGSVTF